MKLGKTDESNPADWFAFAAERLLAADVLSRHDGTSASSVEALLCTRRPSVTSRDFSSRRGGRSSARTI